ncbi:hypothetical protein M8J77_010196 [Diaphorina citri]|nr:hypothetical protein M8J77_010196 [Diaphorina citri]
MLNPSALLTSRLTEIVSTYGLSVLPSEPTHHGLNGTSSQIDLTLTVQTERVKLYIQLPVPGISRHDMLCLAYSIKVPKYPVRMIRYRDFRRLDADVLSECLGEVRWMDVMSDNHIDHVDQKAMLVSDLLLEVFDRVAPMVEKRATRPPIPWMNSNIKTNMALRDQLWSKYKRTRLPADRVAYTTQKNATNYMIRRAQRQFSAGILRGGAKSTWRKLNFLGIGNLKSSPPVIFELDELNNYFVSVVASPCPVLKESVLQAIQSEADTYNIPSEVSFTFEEVTEEKVGSAILGIKSLARGYDGIDIRMLKLSLPHILPAVTHVFNESLTSGVFPSSWCSAEVVPLNKVVSPASCGDYRPVAILPVLSKALERIATLQMLQYIEYFNIMDPYQSGFRRQHSTATALVKVTDDIRLALDTRKVTVLVLLDMSKAFDSVDFDVLLAMLGRVRFSSSALSWIESYLRGRRQRVKQHGQVSDWKDISSGVPQGSVAGPLLFSLYISGIQHVFQFCKYHTYADDIQIYVHCLPEKLAETIRMLNGELAKFQDWARKLFLKPNPSKTKALIIGTDHFHSSVLPTISVPPILLDGTEIPVVKDARNLGVVIDSSLSFSAHISHLRKKVFYCLYTLGRFKKLFPMELKRKLVESLIFPHFDYCDSVYGGLNGELGQSLQMAQNACVRFACNLRKFDHLTDSYAQLGWLKLNQRREIHALTLLFKVLNTLKPQYLRDIFGFLSEAGQYQTRSQNTRVLEIPLHRTLAYSNSFHVRTVRLWNDLPVVFRNAISVESFKILIADYYNESLEV